MGAQIDLMILQSQFFAQMMPMGQDGRHGEPEQLGDVLVCSSVLLHDHTFPTMFL